MSPMRGRRNFFGPAVALALLAFAPAPGRAADDTGKAMTELRAALEQQHDEASLRPPLRPLALQLGGSFSEREAREGRRAFRITLIDPIPARRLIAAMGWERPYAVAGDTHQNVWSLRLWTGDVDDRSGARIATHTPHVGAWAVDASLAGRPKGELSRLSSGGSPAYDLLRGDDTSVVSILIEPWSEGSQAADRMKEPQGDAAPTFVLDKKQIEDWLEKNKALGYPRYFDSEGAAPDMRVLAAWNIPYSGLNWTDFWVYCLAPTSGWTLLESGYFRPLEDQAHGAVLDEATAEVRFLGRDGTVYHRVPVDGCKVKRP